MDAARSQPFCPAKFGGGLVAGGEISNISVPPGPPRAFVPRPGPYFASLLSVVPSPRHVLSYSVYSTLGLGQKKELKGALQIPGPPSNLWDALMLLDLYTPPLNKPLQLNASGAVTTGPCHTSVSPPLNPTRTGCFSFCLRLDAVRCADAKIALASIPLPFSVACHAYHPILTRTIWRHSWEDGPGQNYRQWRPVVPPLCMPASNQTTILAGTNTIKITSQKLDLCLSLGFLLGKRQRAEDIIFAKSQGRFQAPITYSLKFSPSVSGLLTGRSGLTMFTDRHEVPVMAKIILTAFFYCCATPAPLNPHFVLFGTFGDTCHTMGSSGMSSWLESLGFSKDYGDNNRKLVKLRLSKLKSYRLSCGLTDALSSLSGCRVGAEERCQVNFKEIGFVSSRLFVRLHAAAGWLVTDQTLGNIDSQLKEAREGGLRMYAAMMRTTASGSRLKQTQLRNRGSAANPQNQIRGGGRFSMLHVLYIGASDPAIIGDHSGMLWYENISEHTAPARYFGLESSSPSLDVLKLVRVQLSSRCGPSEPSKSSNDPRRGSLGSFSLGRAGGQVVSDLAEETTLNGEKGHPRSSIHW
ncbi:uncharacterized protein CLUP02_09496 [Colletotrichum lupini]|uniref:Uncharacterized protein n=1 Tax=Colletotrichum lupini TaxID=145971 RepID=A0A9Q8SV22_9PEZI|nr:uncharacterized protein CLUP02_09496 [Colletotrichum lupini]UQC84000.1 hypothetical protein CLUP02_09496 [Colletotrichum lupini]